MTDSGRAETATRTWPGDGESVERREIEGMPFRTSKDKPRSPRQLSLCLITGIYFMISVPASTWAVPGFGNAEVGAPPPATEEQRCQHPPSPLPLKCENPSGTKTLIHEGFDPYGPNPEPASFKLYDIEGESLLHTFEVEDFGRSISRILWLDDRRALVQSEGLFYAVLDTERKLLETRFLGGAVTASPTGRALSYKFPAIPRYGPAELREETDRVALAWLSEQISRNKGWEHWQVYPDLAPYRAGRGPEEPIVHTVATPLEWSPEGRRVAFVDESEAGTFLVVVIVPRSEADEPQVERFPFPEPETSQEGSPRDTEQQIEDLSWGPEGKSILVETPAGPLEFALVGATDPSRGAPGAGEDGAHLFEPGGAGGVVQGELSTARSPPPEPPGPGGRPAELPAEPPRVQSG